MTDQISDEMRSTILGALACQPEVAFGGTTVTGVIIPDNGGWDRNKIAVVQLDTAQPAPAGKMHMRVRFSPAAQTSAGFADEGAYRDFLAGVRLHRELCLFGTFDLEAASVDPGGNDGQAERWATVVAARDVRPANPNEVQAAVAARLRNGIAAAHILGLTPSMTSDELMAVMRDRDDDPGFSPRA